MPVLDRYLFRATMTTFVSALVVLTSVVWVTQALRDFDLVTARGQTLWTFLAVTGLAVPSLALIVAPVALFGAGLFVLNRLNADAELAVLSASGVTPWRLFRPLLAVALVVSLAVGALSISAIPSSLRGLRDIVTNIRADVVVNILREGNFTSMGDGITVHIRERTRGGVLRGIFVQDDRDPEQSVTYIAELGEVVENDSGTFLVLEKGSLQRRQARSEDIPIVSFERYAFDLSPLRAVASAVTNYKPRERYTSELLSPDAGDEMYRSVPGRFRAELHDRLVAPLYPVAFMFIAFAAVGRARTTRQNRAFGVMVAIAAVFALRLAGFGLVNLASASAAVVPLIYLAPLGAMAVSAFIISGRRLPRPARRRRPLAIAAAGR